MDGVIVARDWTRRRLAAGSLEFRVRRTRIPAIWWRIARTAPRWHRLRGALAIAPIMLGWLWSPPRFRARLSARRSSS